MGITLVLAPSRGSKLYRNHDEPLQIQVKGEGGSWLVPMLLIAGTQIEFRDIERSNSTIQIKPTQEYLLINLSNRSITLEFSQDYRNHDILFDPYRYENSPFAAIDPSEFTKTHTIPPGYNDILTKWYSIKFTYPEKNLIFLRPHLGISIQSHIKRTEDWRIIEGHPYIIANSVMHYVVKPGDTFHTDNGKIHAIFNPTDEWVAIEETYTGKFDEEDIMRIFNPNHYHS